MPKRGDGSRVSDIILFQAHYYMLKDIKEPLKHIIVPGKVHGKILIFFHKNMRTLHRHSVKKIVNCWLNLITYASILCCFVKTW